MTDNITHNNKPSQKLSYKQKMKVNQGETYPNFIVNTVDYYINQVDTYNAEWKYELQQLARVREGKLEDESVYSYITNPFNETNPKNAPTRLRNYDILNPVLDLLIGERGEREVSYQVVSVNSDTINSAKEELAADMYNNLVDNLYYNIRSNIDPQFAENEEVPEDPSAYYEKIATNYDDTRAIIGQEAMDYLNYWLDLKDLEIELFDDWLTYGRCFTFKEVYKDDIYEEVIKPEEITPIGNRRSKFIEDYEAVIRASSWTIGELIDRFRGDLKDKDIEWLESKAGDNTLEYDTNLWNGRNILNESNNGLITLYHVEWDTYKQIKVLTYKNRMGEINEIEVDETYTLDKSHGDIKIKKEYIREKWECYRVEDKLYLEFGPIAEERTYMNNSSNCKSRYNGIISTRDVTNVNSILKKGLAYQRLYNIFHYQFEKIMNKNKESLMLMPIGLIPKGWKMEKFLYWVDATGFAWFDESKKNINSVLQGLKSVNLSLANYAQQMIELMAYIKNEWWDSVGMNRQRFGDVMASDGKGNTEQATFRSAIITKELNRKFDKFLETDYQGLLDFTKLAWVDGKKGWYINSDDRKVFLEYNPENDPEADYGIFIKNTTKEYDKLQELKEFGKFLVQNGMPANLMPEIIDATNFSKIKKIINKAYQAQEELTQANQDADRENAILIEEKENEREHKKRLGDREKALINYFALVDSASIHAKQKVDSDKLKQAGIKEEDIDLVEEFLNRDITEFRKEKSKEDSTRINDQIKRDKANQIPTRTSKE